MFNWQRFFLLGLSAIYSFSLLAGSRSFAQCIGDEATVVQGVNTAGTVRVNMLANLEALLNITANGAAIIGIIWASVLLVTVHRCMKTNSRKAKIRIAFGVCILALALATPGLVNWLVAAARDANLFT